MKRLSAMLMPDEKRKISKIGKFFQHLAKKLDSLWPFNRWDWVGDMSYMGPKLAIRFFFGRIWDKITLVVFRERLFRSIAYFKKGWYSFDFDSACAMDDFCWKLERIANVLEKHGIAVDSDKRAKEIRHTVFLLRRVIADDYYFENCEPIEEKYGHIVMNWEAKPDESGGIPHTRLFGPRSKSVPADQPIIKKLEKEAMERAIYQRQRDWEYALKTIQKHFWTWWD